MAEQRPFRVLIAGGGVAGLSLANALERGGVDFLLLERRNEIAPQAGASIGMLPNGCRILDQLGLYDELYSQTEPIQWAADRDNTGNLISRPSDFAKLNTARTGYDVSFGDRQILLQVLSNGIKDKSKVLLGKKIVDVEYHPDRVVVKCEDGTWYEGDILAGADGIYSKTREAVWGFAAEQEPEAVERDKQAITAEYQCLFGIANPTDGYAIGDVDYCYDKGRSCLLAVSKGGRTYYFIFQRLDKTIKGIENMPHYTRKDVEEYARAHGDMMLRPGIPFSKIWANTVSSNLVVLEEATFKVWTWGRIACLGDSVHKMTPNTGYGGNAAIESAAMLASKIKEMLNATDGIRPDENKIKACLESYQKGRQGRAGTVVWVSGQTTRLQALSHPLHRLFVSYCLPYLGDYLADTVSDMMVGATAIDYLPLPRRSALGTMPYNPTQGDGKEESKLVRLAIGLPFLVLFFFARKMIDPAQFVPIATEILQNRGRLPWGDTSVTGFFHLRWLDDLLAPLVIFFSPVMYGFDSVSPQAFLFLIDYGVVLAIWLIESVRRANKFTPAQLPLFFALIAQFVSIAAVSPLYYLLHYLLSPIEKFKATDMRLTRINYTKSVLPALMLAYYLPLYAAFFAPAFSTRLASIFAWQVFPVYLSLAASQVLSRFFFADTMGHDRIYSVKRDLLAIRLTIGVLAFHSAAAWAYTFLTAAACSPTAMLALFLPPAFSGENGAAVITTTTTTATNLVQFTGRFLRLDCAFLFANTFLWLAYLFWDVKHAGMLRLSWAWIILLAAIATAGVGPGATVGLGWLWREELLATRRHKEAVTVDKVREWSRRLGADRDEEDGNKSVNGGKK
ncbi:FAD binding domain protein [Lasiosphaeria hispida]|uniref:FAD binding domain protein n=1 Tax=Lasiosphaeria hispida TaxID=260671 RepID=A0AAJ0MJZ2_9PEZI|nr:FAD binding domain protein [Lasiosphaeria hispida]